MKFYFEMRIELHLKFSCPYLGQSGFVPIQNTVLEVGRTYSIYESTESSDYNQPVHKVYCVEPKILYNLVGVV